jgi:uncharacterized membrane protein
MITVQHIHPMLVHFPIVLFLLLAVVDTVATLRAVPVTGRTAMGNASTGLALLSGLFAIAAYVLGDMALEFAEAGGFHSDVAEIHEGLGEATAATFAVWAVIRVIAWWRMKVQGAAAGLLSVVELAGAALVITTAFYGGNLVYDLGVNVAVAAGS